MRELYISPKVTQIASVKDLTLAGNANTSLDIEITFGSGGATVEVGTGMS